MTETISELTPNTDTPSVQPMVVDKKSKRIELAKILLERHFKKVIYDE